MNVIPIKTTEQVELIRKSALLVSETLSKVAEFIKPGITTLQIDSLVDQFICSHEGVVPSFKNYKGFPFSICASVNEEVVHGFPSEDRILKTQDVISIDVGVFMNGFHGDSAFTFYLLDGENPNPKTLDLLLTTRQSLEEATKLCVAGSRIGDIGDAVQRVCESKDYGVVRELTGHGIGKKLHESPNVPNYGKKGQGAKLQEGMVIAVEPMITMGKRQIRVEADDWTITTRDKQIAAHYEHTIAVGKKQSDILSDFAIIDRAIAKNPYLHAVSL